MKKILNEWRKFTNKINEQVSVPALPAAGAAAGAAAATKDKFAELGSGIQAGLEKLRTLPGQEPSPASAPASAPAAVPIAPVVVGTAASAASATPSPAAAAASTAASVTPSPSPAAAAPTGPGEDPLAGFKSVVEKVSAELEDVPDIGALIDEIPAPAAGSGARPTSKHYAPTPAGAAREAAGQIPVEMAKRLDAFFRGEGGLDEP